MLGNHFKNWIFFNSHNQPQPQRIKKDGHKMPRTIRVKVYQFSELSEQAKAIATVNEAIRFQLFLSGRTKKEFTHSELDAAKNRILKHKYEFKADGTRF